MKQECILERRPFSKDGRFQKTSIIIVNIGSRTHGGISVHPSNIILGSSKSLGGSPGVIFGGRGAAVQK
jgi:hypothetical protein